MRVAYKRGRLTLFFVQGVKLSEHIDWDQSDQNSTFLMPLKKFFVLSDVWSPRVFFKYWMCQAEVFVKCQMCQSPSVYMPYNALSNSFTEGSFIYSLPLHYTSITPLTAFQLNFPIFAFYKMSKRQAYDVKLQTNLQIVKPADNRPISSCINLT